MKDCNAVSLELTFVEFLLLMYRECVETFGTEGQADQQALCGYSC